MGQQRRGYDEEFISNAVELSHQEGKTVVSVARDLGIPFKTLRNWRARNVKQVEQASQPKEFSDLESQNAELRRQLKHMELQRDILKKALAICSSPIEPDKFTR